MIRTNGKNKIEYGAMNGVKFGFFDQQYYRPQCLHQRL